MKPHMQPTLRLALASTLFFTLVACSSTQVPPEPENVLPLSEVQGDVARLALNPSALILAPGASAELEVTYQDSEGNTLGPADPAATTLNLSGAGFSAAWTGPGRVTLSAPESIATGYLGASLTNDPQVFGVSSASVVDLRPGVVDLPDSTIVFPRTDYDFGNQTGDLIGTHLFEPFTEAEFAQTVSDDPSRAPLFPVVLEGAESLSLRAGDLIVGSGGGFLYGRVEQVVAERGGRTLLAVRAVLPDAVFGSFDAGFDYEALEADKVVPETLELELPLAPIEGGELGTQALSHECGADHKLLTVKTDMRLDFSLNNVALNSDLDISSLGELSATCEVKYAYPIPVGGVMSFVVLPTATFEGTVGASVAANQGEFRPQASMHVTSSTQLLPKLQVLASPQPDMHFDPLPQFGDWGDVNGGDGYVRFSAESEIRGGVAFTFLGTVGRAIDLLKLKPLKDKHARIANLIGNAVNGVTAEAYVSVEPKLTGQWATMRSALNDASSKAFDKLTLGLGAELSGGYALDVLTYLWGDLELENKGEIVVFENTYLPAQLSVEVTSDDGNGSAVIEVNKAANDPSLSKVQLGSNPVNSLHGDETPVTGGNVGYDPAECDALGSVKADTLAIAQLPIFSIGAPFNSHEEVEVCKRPDISEPTPNPLQLAAEIYHYEIGSFSFGNAGKADLTYSLSKGWSNSHLLKITSPTSGTLAPGETATVDIEVFCDGRPTTRNLTVNIRSNDPDTPDVTAAIELVCWRVVESTRYLASRKSSPSGMQSVDVEGDRHCIHYLTPGVSTNTGHIIYQEAAFYSQVHPECADAAEETHAYMDSRNPTLMQKAVDYFIAEKLKPNQCIVSGSAYFDFPRFYATVRSYTNREVSGRPYCVEE